MNSFHNYKYMLKQLNFGQTLFTHFACDTVKITRNSRFSKKKALIKN